MRRGRGGGVLVLALALTLLACGTDGALDRPEVDVPEVSWTFPVLEARYGRLARGANLDVTLRELGLAAGDAVQIGREVDRVHPVRQLRPGVPFAVHVDELELPAAFEIWPATQHGVRVERSGEEWRGRPVERALEPYVQLLKGEIETSLSDAIVDAGGNAALVLTVSDILQWDVDFFIDPRPGDSFSVLVEAWVDGQEVVSYGDVVAIRYDGAMTDAEAILFRDDDSIHYFHPDGTSVRRSLLKSPLNFRRVSSHFSHRRMHPILRRYRPHLGVDYAADMGTPVVALGDGTVTIAATKGGFGKTVALKHTGNLVTQYGHLSKYGKGIKKGVRVAQGDVIGYVGSTGLSTGPHLDFRCKLNGAWVNPLTMERPVAEPLRASARADFGRFAASCLDLIGECSRNGFFHRAGLRDRYPRIADSGARGPERAAEGPEPGNEPSG